LTLQEDGHNSWTSGGGSRTAGHFNRSDAKNHKQKQIQQMIRSSKRGGSPTQSRFEPPPLTKRAMCDGLTQEMCHRGASQAWVIS
jgi:hypothetical protein